jgi:pyruvate/2-oxoglutarate dehydrogenase complex dihydrolipoamide dehydrogenase (E3) component
VPRTWDNRDITGTKEIPERLLVLGGGVIGVEMAQACVASGRDEVTIVEALEDRLLGREEPFVGTEVQAALEADGITVEVGARAERVEREGTDGPVTLTLSGPQPHRDELLVAVGRRAPTDDLGLDTSASSRDAAGSSRSTITSAFRARLAVRRR